VSSLSAADREPKEVAAGPGITRHAIPVAVDNASGFAVMIEVARQPSTVPDPCLTVQLTAFGAEA
jgi:Zn-dependent M28 family amino/carboxypeptidase